MRLARYPTALRAWRKHCPPGRRKYDVLRPGIVGMRGSMVHTATAMHGNEYARPPPFIICEAFRGEEEGQIGWDSSVLCGDGLIPRGIATTTTTEAAYLVPGMQ